MKIREGRGFSLEELKAAGIQKKQALSIGIAIDHRARTRSEERLSRNVERLQAYKARLVVFPKNSKKPKKADSTVSAGLTLTSASAKLFYSDRATNSRQRRRATSPQPSPCLPMKPRSREPLQAKKRNSRPMLLCAKSDQMPVSSALEQRECKPRPKRKLRRPANRQVPVWLEEKAKGPGMSLEQHSGARSSFHSHLRLWLSPCNVYFYALNAC